MSGSIRDIPFGYDRISLIASHILILSLVLFFSCKSRATEENRDAGQIQVLFLGHASEHHNSARFMPMLASALAGDSIHFTYTDDPASLNRTTLSGYDVLLIYANYDSITPSQEKALLGYVEGGKGFVAVHSASYCFRNSEKYVNLVGAQFKSHETETFRTEIIRPGHPAMKGVREFTTWDETYVHSMHSPDRTILMERVEGDHREPWTWVKQYGKGRVFYTAYGHDEHTWGNPGFHVLMKQGILWAAGERIIVK